MLFGFTTKDPTFNILKYVHGSIFSQNINLVSSSSALLFIHIISLLLLLLELVNCEKYITYVCIMIISQGFLLTFFPFLGCPACGVSCVLYASLVFGFVSCVHMCMCDV